jgi:hypothetical protein
MIARVINYLPHSHLVDVKKWLFGHFEGLHLRLKNECYLEHTRSLDILSMSFVLSFWSLKVKGNVENSKKIELT